MKKALCVGIGRFQNAYISPLAGCVNDALLMANMLKERFAFTTAGVRVLTDENANKEEVLKRLEWLVSDSQSGDILVFTASSHGTWTVDRTGTEDPASELDGKDEVFVCYDHSKSNMLIDDEIAEKLKKVPSGVSVYCVIDTCHSGTITRGVMPDFGGSALPKIVHNRYLSPDVDIMNRFRPSMGWVSRSVSTDDQINRIVFSACKDSETALDLPTPSGNHGLLTYSLYRSLEDSNWNISVQDLHKKTLSRVASVASNLGHTQTPQMHGPASMHTQIAFK